MKKLKLSVETLRAFPTNPSCVFPTGGSKRLSGDRCTAHSEACGSTDSCACKP
jgi:hypothetical protein